MVLVKSNYGRGWVEVHCCGLNLSVNLEEMEFYVYWNLIMGIVRTTKLLNGWVDLDNEISYELERMLIS